MKVGYFKGRRKGKGILLYSRLYLGDYSVAMKVFLDQ